MQCMGHHKLWVYQSESRRHIPTFLRDLGIFFSGGLRLFTGDDVRIITNIMIMTRYGWKNLAMLNIIEFYKIIYIIYITYICYLSIYITITLYCRDVCTYWISSDHDDSYSRLLCFQSQLFRWQNTLREKDNI